jgi:hypothetical protein
VVFAKGQKTMALIEARYGRQSGGRRRVGKNTVYLGRDKNTKKIDKACFNIDPAIIDLVGWKHHDRIRFFYDPQEKFFHLVRDPKKGYLLQIRKEKGAASRLVLPKDLLTETLFEWFPALRSIECKTKTIECEIARIDTTYDLKVTDFQILDK